MSTPEPNIYLQLQPIRNQLFQERSPQIAWDALQVLLQQSHQHLNPQEFNALIELSGMTLRALHRYREAAELYRNNGDRYQSGYCEMLLGNLNAMQNDWALVIQSRANHWCLTLFGLITQQLNSFATMLQIRNHLESDVANLLAANRWDYMQTLLYYADIMAQMNLESPKFIGRGILNHLIGHDINAPSHSPLVPYAEQLLLKGQKALPNDPEIYYHLGQFRHLTGEYTDARLMLKQCLLISPSYTPAKELMALMK